MFCMKYSFHLISFQKKPFRLFILKYRYKKSRHQNAEVFFKPDLWKHDFYLYQLTGGNEYSLNVHHEVLPEPPILLEDEIY